VTIQGPETVERGQSAEYRVVTLDDEDNLSTVEWATIGSENQGCTAITNADWPFASETRTLDRDAPYEFQPDTLQVMCICARATDSHGAVGFSSPCVRVVPVTATPVARIVDVEKYASEATRPLCSTIHLSAESSTFPKSKDDEVKFSWAATDPSGGSITLGYCGGIPDQVKEQHRCINAAVSGTYTVTLSITDTPLSGVGGGPLTSEPVTFVAKVAADRPAWLLRTDPAWDAQHVLLGSNESRTFAVSSVDDDCEPIPAPVGKKEARLVWSIWDPTGTVPQWVYLATSSRSLEVTQEWFPNRALGDTGKIRVEVLDAAAETLYKTPGYSPCLEETDICCEAGNCTDSPPHVRWTTWTVHFQP